MRMRRVLLLIVPIVLLIAPAVRGQMSDYEHLTLSRFGEAKTEVFYETDSTFQQDVGGQDSEFQMSTYDFRLRVPVYQDERRLLSLKPMVRFRDIETDARLPDTGEIFPNGLWDVGVTATYKQKLDNGWTAGGWLAISSPSDRPFHSLDNVKVLANFVLLTPAADERDQWVFLLNYSNVRDFARHVPLPGVGYQFDRGDTLSGLVGLPILFLRYTPDERWTLQGRYLIPRNVDARVGYRLFDDVELYGRYTWGGDPFLRHDRRDDDDMLVYYEMRAALGVAWEIHDRVTLDASAGWAFDRFWYEGEDYDDRGRNRINLSDGPVAQVNLRIEI